MDLSLFTHRWQQRALIALVALSPVLVWRPIDDRFGLPKATLTLVVAIGLATLGALRALTERRVLLPRHPLVWAVTAFAGALLVTGVLSTNRALSFVGDTEFYAGVIGTVACLVVALVVARVFEEAWAGWFLAAIAGGAAVTALYAIVQRLEADPLTWGYAGAGFVFSTMGNPNFAAAVAGIGAPIAAGLALLPSWPRPLRLAAAATSVVCVGGALATTSFQGAAAAAAGLAVVAVAAFFANRATLVARWGSARLAAVALGALVLLGAVTLGGVDDVGAALDNGFDERGLIWRTALDVIADHPVVGTGPDTFGQVFLAERPVEHAVRFSYTRADQAHDIPLNMFATGGVLLGVTYLAVVVITAVVLVRGIVRGTGDRAVLLAAAGGGWVAYQVQSLVSLDTPTLLLWHWVLTALVFVLALDPPFAEYLLPGGTPTSTKPSKRQRRPRTSGSAVAAVVVVGLLAAWFATRPFRAHLAIERAQGHLTSNNVAAAYGEAKKATRLAGWSADAWLLRTQIEEASRDVDNAVASATNAARRDAGDPDLAIVAARLVQAYRPQDENPWWEEAIDRDPNDPANLAAVAQGLRVVRPDRADELVRRALEIDDQSYVVWIALGDVLLEADDVDGAREAYERSIELRPDGGGTEGLRRLEERESGEG
jgi:O-antigen ligase/Tfp pilus assembly protein PilF